MASKTLFASAQRALRKPAADTRNRAGGLAYSMSPRHALAQYVATGCLGDTFYAHAQVELQQLQKLCTQVDPLFMAQCAIYGRRHGYMKDMPALLLAELSIYDSALCERIAPLVLDNGKMLRNFVQILRSGVTGRQSLGTVPKRIVRQWLQDRSDDAVFRASVGNDPSLADVIKMVHPRPATDSRRALYGYLLGRDVDHPDHLPQLVQQYEAWKAKPSGTPPDLPFQMLTGLQLGRDQWTQIARDAGWQMTRMNLNTFARHGVFDVPGMTDLIAKRLRSEQAIRRARVFPYQLLAAYMHTAHAAGTLPSYCYGFWGGVRQPQVVQRDRQVPAQVIDALQDAMEIAVANVPAIHGHVVVAVDVSGSMGQSVSGARGSATSVVRCVDVAALMGAAILRNNRQARIMPFDTRVHDARLNPRDSIMTNARTLAKFGGGGTNCSLPLQKLVQEKAPVDLVIMVSDNESWVDTRSHGATAFTDAWDRIRQKNPRARLVCIDLVPNATTQARDSHDILNIGGFSDVVFDLIAKFAADQLTDSHWTQVISQIQIPEPVST